MPATITPGYTFGSTEQVTNTKLGLLVSAATISGIDQTNLANGIGIVVYSTVAPTNASCVWVDTANNVVKVYLGAAWVELPTISSPTAGQVPQYNGTHWAGATLFSGVTGQFKNLKVVQTNVTTVTVTADELVLDTGIRVTSVNQAAAITTSGAGGLDTGTEANIWYYIWIIRKSSDGTTAALLSASSTSPTMPSGYDQKACVGAVHNTSGDFVAFTQSGRIVQYTTWQTMVSYSSTTSNAWVSVDVTSFVPSGISTYITGAMTGHFPNANYMAVSNKNAGTPGGEGANTVVGGQQTIGGMFLFDLITANTMYYGDTASIQSGKIYCSGFVINGL